MAFQSLNSSDNFPDTGGSSVSFLALGVFVFLVVKGYVAPEAKK